MIISYWDLSKVLDFISIILDQNLIGSENKEDEIKLTALSIAIIVTYWKPFSVNKNSLDVKPFLPNNSIKAFDELELKLHKSLKKARNGEFAHSDPEAHEIDVAVSKINDQNIFIPTGRNVYIPMEEIDIQRLKEMVIKILKWISKEVNRIQNIKEINKDF